jgi:UDPglucose--hexose-1-phosphate uridylyltransferase
MREWVCVAAHRQDRPQMPANWCPFCPGSGRVPDSYDVFLYPNDFAAFQLDNPPFAPETGLFRSTGARGATDVVLYHPNHTLLPSAMPAEHWLKVVDLWTSRYAELAANPDIAYVYTFENTGVAIGVTMPHPHGQIYSFPFVPPLVERQLAAAAEHYAREGECLYCRLLHDELADGRRIVAANESFVAFVPFCARYPAEMQIYARRHVSALTDFTDQERARLATLIKTVRMKYDNLFGFPMPLMMILRQRPTRGEHPHAHFHIEFFPIQRSATKLKFMAGVESGAGTFLNDTIAEEKAKELRETEPIV